MMLILPNDKAYQSGNTAGRRIERPSWRDAQVIRSESTRAPARRSRAGFPACRFTGLSSLVFMDERLESRPNRQAGKPALRTQNRYDFGGYEALEKARSRGSILLIT